MNKSNKKGQALVEFVLILPIFLMIIFAVIDFANVFYQKNELETVLDQVVEEVKNNKPVNTEVNYDVIDYGTTKKIVISKDIDLVTPFSNIFFSNPYTIKTERVITSE